MILSPSLYRFPKVSLTESGFNDLTEIAEEELKR